MRWKITPPHARPRVTIAVRISCGKPNGARKSASKPDRGIVRNKVEVLNQAGQIVLSSVHNLLMGRRSDD